MRNASREKGKVKQGARYASVAEYLDSCTPEARRTLQSLRNLLLRALPGATDVISYNMPAIKTHRILLWYAAWKHHIALYPVSADAPGLKRYLGRYRGTKGSIHLPIGQRLPAAVIIKIVRFRQRQEAKRS